MRAFRAALAAAQPASDAGRRWIYVPYDQLTDAVGPLAAADPSTLGIVLVESLDKPARRPYHRQKLALLLASQRHFALEQAARGVSVDHRASRRPFADVLREVTARRGPLECMRPAERELRAELAPLVREGLLRFLPHAGWLTAAEDLHAAGGPPWRNDAFYRHVRRRTGILMERGKPVGGRFSFDGENRKPWRGDPPAPTPPRFQPDAITHEVLDLLRGDGPLAGHPGALDPGALPATRAQVDALWAWALAECLPHFGPFEDALSARSRRLFHSGVAPLINLHRLSPARVVGDVLAAPDLPLPSREGFIRQVLGWRELVHHVHEATDGFRVLPDNPAFTGAPFALPPTGPDDGADPNHLGATSPLPPAFWGETPSGLACLDDTVAAVWEDGWTHHIARLMVQSNLATLLDVRPRALADWFWVGFTDAYDWVVEPNVLAMGTFAVGPLMTTKPYVSGAAYVHRMGDHCAGCAFHPKRDCPLTPMYWAFLDRHAAALAPLERMALPLKALATRSPAQRAEDRAVFEATRAALLRGERLVPGRGA